MQAKLCLFFLLSFLHGILFGQPPKGEINSFYMSDSVLVTIDKPAAWKKNKEAIIVFYALPNGNTTKQTMGKKMEPGDDWHFDIQHIRAQTAFVRQQLRRKNFVVIYLENYLKSWPAWKQRNPSFQEKIPHIVDSLANLVKPGKKSIYLNGHSGGGSFIFGYLAGVEKIPAHIKRISFIDSNYGYDSSYYPVFSKWLREVRGSSLNLFAYNDSIALYNGKPVVSATGGTWYRGHMFLRHLQHDFVFEKANHDSLFIYQSADKRIQFFFKPNHDKGIYHTQQVELNGFIHSILCGTRWENKGYRYYDKRAYASFIY